METRVMTAHIPRPLAERVDALAAQLERSRGWIIKQALTAWVEEEERHQATLEALEEVDAAGAGGVAHEAVRTWIESLDTTQPLPPPHR